MSKTGLGANTANICYALKTFVQQWKWKCIGARTAYQPQELSALDICWYVS